MDKKTTLKERTDLIIAFVVIILSGAFVYSKIVANSPIEEIPKTLSKKENVSHFISAKSDEQHLDLVSETYKIDASSKKDSSKQDKGELEILPIFSFPTSSTCIKSKINTNIEEVTVEKETFVPKQTNDKIAKEAISINTIKESKYNSEEYIQVKDSIVEDSNIKSKLIEKDTALYKNSGSQKHLIPETKTGCTAVVGVFEQIANKNKVINKLTKLGYAHKQGVLKNGLTYVGVPVACENQLEKRKLIKELNTAFNIEAWVKGNN